MPVQKYGRECWKGWSSSLAAFFFCAMDKFEYRTVTRAKQSLQWGPIYFNGLSLTFWILLVSSAWNEFWLLTNGPRPVTGQAFGSNSKSSLEYGTSICSWEMTLEVILCPQCTCLAAAPLWKLSAPWAEMVASVTWVSLEKLWELAGAVIPHCCHSVGRGSMEGWGKQVNCFLLSESWVSSLVQNWICEIVSKSLQLSEMVLGSSLKSSS